MSSLLKQVVGTEHDYEWYPTTREILSTVYQSMKEDFKKHSFDRELTPFSMLDIGAGNGSVFSILNDLAKTDEDHKDAKWSDMFRKKFAVEKSRPLLDALPADVYIVGTDFDEMTLLDKGGLDAIFCNPPYSRYDQFVSKIILQAVTCYVYFVIPSRWKTNQNILNALEVRKAKFEVLGSFTFENAEVRSARTKVDIVKIKLGVQGGFHSEYQVKPFVDPFDIWFEETFGDFTKPKASDDEESPQAKTFREKLKYSLVQGETLVQALENLYQQELLHLHINYHKMSELDPELLKVMDISLKAVKESLKQRITGLKSKYWRELFDRLDRITSRLTNESRQKILDKLNSHTQVEFSSSNAYGILSWAIKNANGYYESQLVDVYSSFINKASVLLYKSNKLVYSSNDWQYYNENLNVRGPRDLSQFKLDYRIVTHRVGGISSSGYSYEQTNGLAISAVTFVNDLVTIANNLGFECNLRAVDFQWEPGQPNSFMAKDVQTGEKVALFDVKAFKNGNLHFKMGQRFICALNVEFGRLQGWLHSAEEASEELDIPIEMAQSAYKANYMITGNPGQLLLTSTN